MHSGILKILNDELIELRRMTKLAQDRLDLQREDLNETKRKSEEFRKWMVRENKAQQRRMEDHELRMQHSEENQKFMKQGLEILLSKIQSIDEKVDRGLGGTSSQ